MTPAVASRSEFVAVRGLRYHVRTWGSADKPRLFLLHGMLDVSASFQFVAELLADEWHVVAPDWRGYGLTEWPRDNYWIPDYVADLDGLLDRYAPTGRATLIGHSLGGNVATMYAAVRPARVAVLISIEGVGVWSDRADDAPARLTRWLDEVRVPPPAGPSPTIEGVTAILRRNNPGLTDERARFLAEHFLERQGTTFRPRNDPLHKLAYPILFRQDEWIAFLRQIEARTYWITAARSPLARWFDLSPQELDERRKAFRHLEETTIPGCGHCIHYEKPEALAAVIRQFLTAERGAPGSDTGR